MSNRFAFYCVQAQCQLNYVKNDKAVASVYWWVYSSVCAHKAIMCYWYVRDGSNGLSGVFSLHSNSTVTVKNRRQKQQYATISNLDPNKYNITYYAKETLRYE